MSTAITERVAYGVVWLDENMPGWVDRIDLDELSMRSVCNCVLGQLFDGDFYNAPLTPTDAVARGFDTVISARTREDNVRAAAEFELLTTEWTRVIEERRAVSA